MNTTTAVFPASNFPELMFDTKDVTLLPVVPIVPVSLVSDSSGVAGVVGVVFPRAFVEAGGAFGGGGGGIVPEGGGGMSTEGAGLESGICLLILYFTQEFQARQSNFLFAECGLLL